MTSDVIRRVALFHGITSWLGAVLLFVVAVLLVLGQTQDKPWVRSLCVLATITSAVSFASGLALDEHYRMHLRQHLFLASMRLGWLFERKMHLSFGVIVFASIGLLALFVTRDDERLLRASRAAYVFAALFALTACVISLVVQTR